MIVIAGTLIAAAPLRDSGLGIDDTAAPDNTAAPTAPSTVVAGATAEPVAPSEAIGSGVAFGVFSHPARFDETFPQFSALRFLLADTDDAFDYLERARASGTSVVISMTGNAASRNPDNTLNAAGWRAEVDQFADFDFDSYVADGTLIGHYILDEPKCRNCWGGEVLTNAQIDELAAYSKELFPSLPVIVRQGPERLARHAGGLDVAIPGFEWSYVDIAWAQYTESKGPIQAYVEGEIAGAVEQDLGLIWGLNVLAGGDGSSGLHPNAPLDPADWLMSEAEIVRYGTEMLDAGFGCAFINFRYERFEETYFDSDGPLWNGLDSLSEVAADAQAGSCGLRRNG